VRLLKEECKEEGKAKGIKQIGRKDYEKVNHGVKEAWNALKIILDGKMGVLMANKWKSLREPSKGK
jgi:hypothetical protein